MNKFPPSDYDRHVEAELSKMRDRNNPELRPAAGPWIRVEDGMPEPHHAVLIWTFNDGEGLAEWNGREWKDSNGEVLEARSWSPEYRVTHWARVVAPGEGT